MFILLFVGGARTYIGRRPAPSKTIRMARVRVVVHEPSTGQAHTRRVMVRTHMVQARDQRVLLPREARDRQVRTGSDGVAIPGLRVTVDRQNENGRRVTAHDSLSLQLHFLTAGGAAKLRLILHRLSQRQFHKICKVSCALRRRECQAGVALRDFPSLVSAQHKTARHGT